MLSHNFLSLVSLLCNNNEETNEMKIEEIVIMVIMYKRNVVLISNV